MEIIQTFIVSYEGIYTKAHKTQKLVSVSNFGNKMYNYHYFIETSYLIKPITEEEFLDLTNKSNN